MKRSLILLGRLGTVFIFLSFAILLASGIGPVTYGGVSKTGTVPAGTFNVLLGPLFYPYPSSTSLQNLSPQNNAIVSINSTYSLNVYLIEGSKSVLENWIKTSHPEQPTDANQSLNSSILGEFLQANPNLILWQGQGQNIRFDYTPQQIMNLTVIVSNLNVNSSYISYTINIQYGFASIGRMRSVAIWILPIGLLCALPWATLKIIHKPSKH